jgi:hypothetical protein
MQYRGQGRFWRNPRSCFAEKMIMLTWGRQSRGLQYLLGLVYRRRNSVPTVVPKMMYVFQ